MPQRINASQILVAVGATALLVSLFLGWYAPRFRGEPTLTAFTAFEIVDLVLAGLAVAAVATVIPVPSASGAAPPLDSRWLPWIGAAALVLVVVALVNDPPGARDRALETGAWIALGGAGAIAAGGLLSLARISIVVRPRPGEQRRAQPLREKEST